MKVLATTGSACLLLLRSSNAFRPIHKPVFTNRLYSSSTTALKMSQPFAVIVEAEIQPDRVDELLKIMDNNARESRKEPGCLRFGM